MAKILIELTTLNGRVAFQIRRGEEEDDTPAIKRVAQDIVRAISGPVAMTIGQAATSFHTKTESKNVH